MSKPYGNDVSIDDKPMASTNEVEKQAQLFKGSQEEQLKAEAKELDRSNILDDSSGIQTRHANIDATKQEREIDKKVHRHIKKTKVNNPPW